MPGVGKSVLFEHLTGEAYALQHPLPEQPSPDKESGKIIAPHKRIRLVTIPGQESAKRYEAASEVFEGKDPVSGVIHVVANGFASIRTAGQRQDLRTRYGLEDLAGYRNYQRQQEIRDLRRTCEFVQRSILKHKHPVWMFVLASKCDLYADNLAAAENYYSPFGSNEFASELLALQGNVGKLFFSWDSAPACASLEDFEWNAEVARSTVKPSQRDRLIGNILRRVERYCAG